MKNTILKSMLAMGIIAFAASMLAVSCGKVAGGGNNNNNNANNSANNSGSGNSGGSGNDGGGGSGNAGCTGICPTANLVLRPATTPPAWVRISSNTVAISAAGWSAASNPQSDANDNNRGFADAATAGTAVSIFTIKFPSTAVGLWLLNRTNVNKDNIALSAATTACPSSESAETLLAVTTGGGVCREYQRVAKQLVFNSYLGTVFNNTKTGTHARGSMRCTASLDKWDNTGGDHATIDDALLFGNNVLECRIAMLNNAGTAGTAEIDDAWVGDTASVKEVELYALGIDVSGKTIEQFSGLKKVDFDKAMDNAAVKRLLQNNKWGELKFKIKIVNATDFATL